MEIQKYYQNKPRFNGIYSRDNLPKTKDETCILNLDEYSDIGTHWVTLYVQNYFFFVLWSRTYSKRQKGLEHLWVIKT